MANPKEKTPMCLVNELARFNKIQPEYKLLSEQGPAHSKVNIDTVTAIFISSMKRVLCVHARMHEREIYSCEHQKLYKPFMASNELYLPHIALSVSYCPDTT